MFSLVAPVTMSADQTTAWLASAVDALVDIRADEVAAVSLEVRRTVTRPSQIVPKISELVATRRAEQSRWAKLASVEREMMALQPVRKHVMDRDRRHFTAADWAELNEWLASQGSPVRYSSSGEKVAA